MHLCRVRYGVLAAAAVTLVFSGTAHGRENGDTRAAQAGRQAVAAPEEIRDHVNKAEDMVEMLLDWRRALTTSTPNPRETTAPTRAISTLMVVPRAEVKELVGLIEALSRRAPAPSRSGQGPFGDLRAHVDKAAEIARELMPAARAGDGAKAGGSDVITVDRTALERLEIEIDAIERVLPRTLAAR